MGHLKLNLKPSHYMERGGGRNKSCLDHIIEMQGDVEVCELLISVTVWSLWQTLCPQTSLLILWSVFAHVQNSMDIVSSLQVWFCTQAKQTKSENPVPLCCIQTSLPALFGSPAVAAVEQPEQMHTDK